MEYDNAYAAEAREEDNGETMLHLAALAKAPAGTRFLIDQGATVDVFSNGDETPLLMALQQGYPRLMHPVHGLWPMPPIIPVPKKPLKVGAAARVPYSTTRIVGTAVTRLIKRAR